MAKVGVIISLLVVFAAGIEYSEAVPSTPADHCDCACESEAPVLEMQEDHSCEDNCRDCPCRVGLTAALAPFHISLPGNRLEAPALLEPKTRQPGGTSIDIFRPPRS